MRKVEAIVRHFKLEAVKNALRAYPITEPYGRKHP